MPSIPYRHYGTQIGKRLRDNLNLGFQVGSNLSNFSYDAASDLRARSRPRLASALVTGNGYSAPMRRRSFRRRTRRPMRRRFGMKKRGVKKYFNKSGRRRTRNDRIAKTIRSLKPVKYDETNLAGGIFDDGTGYIRTEYRFDPSILPGINNRDSFATYVKMLHIKGGITLSETIDRPVMFCLVVRRRMVNTNTTTDGYFLTSAGTSTAWSRSFTRYGYRLNPVAGVPVYKKWMMLNPQGGSLKTFDIKVKINESIRQLDLGAPMAGVHYYFDVFYVDNSANTTVGNFATMSAAGYMSYVDGA